MFTIDLSGINYLAVGVAALASFIIGALWYGVAFARGWAESHGVTPEMMSAKAKTMGLTFGVYGAMDLLLALGAAVFAAALGVTTPAGGAGLGAMLWLAATLPFAANCDVSEVRSLKAFAIDAGRALVSMLVVGAIVGAWR